MELILFGLLLLGALVFSIGMHSARRPNMPQRSEVKMSIGLKDASSGYPSTNHGYQNMYKLAESGATQESETGARLAFKHTDDRQEITETET